MATSLVEANVPRKRGRISDEVRPPAPARPSTTDDVRFDTIDHLPGCYIITTSNNYDVIYMNKLNNIH